MKRILYIVLYTALMNACSYDDDLTLYDISVQLAEQTVSQHLTADVPVTVIDGNATTFSATTDAEGVAHFRLPAGIYNISVSTIKEIDGTHFIAGGNIAQHVVSATASSHYIQVPLTIVAQDARKLLIKEIYCGGCQKDDGSGIFAMDKCIILYNNSAYDAEIANLGIGMVEPYNAEAPTHNFLNSGVLEYEVEGTLPLINGVWFFADTLRVKAYEEIVVNVCGAIDNTQTYSQSINYADSHYYCMYDPSAMGADGKAYANTSYYPAPAEVIPTSHYLKAVKYGKGNAWPYSVTSPATVIFQTEGMTVAEYANDAANIIYPAGKNGDLTVACLALPRSWVLDGVEIYNADKLADCKKRLTADIDNGFATLTHGYGHAVQRRIDNEASLKAGHDVYIDTNNSTHDFTESQKCSLSRHD